MGEMARITAHYTGEGIAERLLAALAETGGNAVAPSPLDLAPLDQFHSRGLEATRELAEMLRPKAEERLLDIGCGLGGPARLIAYTYGSAIDGIDLTPEFCEAATRLNAVTGLAEQVRVQCASARALPFTDGVFDAAYSQNVVMNIADKTGFYREAWRVLKPGGRLALSNLAQGQGGPPRFPVPWATTAESSFLATPAKTRAEIEEAGFEIVVFRNTTQALLHFYETTRERVRRQGPPKLGIHVWMGERFKEMQRNTARNVEEGRVLSLEILCRKR